MSAAGLAQRIAWAALALAVGVGALIGTVSFLTLSQQLRAQVQTRLEGASQRAARRIDASLAHVHSEIALLAGNSLTTNALLDSAGRLGYLEPFLRQHWLVAEMGFALTVCDYRARLVARSGDGAADCEGLGDWLETLERQDTLRQLRPSTDGGPPEMIIARAIHLPPSGAFEGFVLTRMPLQAWLTPLLTSADGAVRLELTGDAGRRVFAPPERLAAQRPMRHLSPLAADRGGASGALGVQAEVDASLIEGPLRQLTLAYLAIALGLGSLVWWLARLAGRRIATPLVQLRDAVQRLSQDVHAPVSDDLPRRADEVGQLSHAFAGMAAQLSASRRLLDARVAERTQALADANERLSEVLESVSDVLWSYSVRDHRWLYISGAVEAIFGVDAADLQARGDGWQQLLHPHDVALARAGAARGLAEGRSSFECRGRRKDGRSFWLSVRMSLQRDADGHPIRLHGILSDIDGPRRVELERERQLHLLNGLFALSPDGLACFDADGRAVEVNPACERLLGHDRDTLLAGSHADFRARLPGARPRAAADGGTEVVELPGPPSRVLLCTERRSSDGDALTIVYLRDISDEIALDRMKSEFLSTAAHELRTPLASIVGFSDLLLQRDYDAARRRELVAIVHAQAATLARIVDDLLDLARIEARGAQDLALRSVSLAAELRAAAAAMTLPGDPRRVQLHLPARDTQVRADSHQLQRALRNLLSNAFKYSPPDRPVRLEMQPPTPDGRVAVDVVDEGIGMSAEQLGRAFDRFYRADASGSVPGTGLGLSLVREIVGLHDGEVVLHSEPGQGTRARIWLPVPTDPAPASHTHLPEEMPSCTD